MPGQIQDTRSKISINLRACNAFEIEVFIREGGRQKCSEWGLDSDFYLDQIHHRKSKTSIYFELPCERDRFNFNSPT